MGVQSFHSVRHGPRQSMPAARPRREICRERQADYTPAAFSRGASRCGAWPLSSVGWAASSSSDHQLQRLVGLVEVVDGGLALHLLARHHVGVQRLRGGAEGLPRQRSAELWARVRATVGGKWQYSGQRRRGSGGGAARALRSAFSSNPAASSTRSPSSASSAPPGGSHTWWVQSATTTGFTLRAGNAAQRLVCIIVLLAEPTEAAAGRAMTAGAERARRTHRAAVRHARRALAPLRRAPLVAQLARTRGRTRVQGVSRGAPAPRYSRIRAPGRGPARAFSPMCCRSVAAEVRSRSSSRRLRPSSCVARG